MFYEAEQDPLCYPGTKVLINRAGLVEQAELDEFELSMYLSRASEPLPEGDLDYEHYRLIHYHLFQDVYDWAGEQRQIRISKGGSPFAYPEHIERAILPIFQRLAELNGLVGLQQPDFANHAAWVIGEINAVHPFREGNGRTQLAFLKLLTLNAGFAFDDEVLEPERVLTAMISSFHDDREPLASLISDIVA